MAKGYNKEDKSRIDYTPVLSVLSKNILARPIHQFAAGIGKKLDEIDGIIDVPMDYILRRIDKNI